MVALRSRGLVAAAAVVDEAAASGSDTTADAAHHAPLRPRWLTPNHVLFQALLDAPDRTLPRGLLVDKAIALAHQLTQERGLPPLFKGKTPKSSLSACLSKDMDRLFVMFKPPGSRFQHFRPAWTPGDFDEAWLAYSRWQQLLYSHDLPAAYATWSPPVKCRARISHEFRLLHQHFPRDRAILPYLCDPAMLRIHCIKSLNAARLRLKKRLKRAEPRASRKRPRSPSPTPVPSASPPPPTVSDAPPSPSPHPTIAHPSTLAIPDALKPLPLPKSTATTTKAPRTLPPELEAQLHDLMAHKPLPLDSSRPRGKPGAIASPDSWSELVCIRESLLPNAGRGLFALHPIPAWTPIGLYFGVPYTEPHYDRVKEHVGHAARYAIMYRHSVLDATDTAGEPITQPDQPGFCPMHFMNEDPERGNAVFVEGTQPNQVICLATRDIAPGHEILQVYYGDEVDRTHFRPPLHTATTPEPSITDAAASDVDTVASLLTTEPAPPSL